MRRNLDATKLREVKADDWREGRINLAVDVVASSVLVVVGRRAVHAVQRIAHVAHDLVDEVGRLVRASHRVGHRDALLVILEVLLDVVVDLVVRHALHVNVDHVDPDV